MKELEKKPFALVGVNSNAYDAAKLKEVMVKENITWRSTANQEAINKNWNSPGTPVYYVLDPAGVIRYKWVGYPGAKALDAGLEKQIRAAEKKSSR